MDAVPGSRRRHPRHGPALHPHRMISLPWILTLLAVWPLLKLLKFSAVARNLLGLRFGALTVREAPLEGIPPYFAELAKPDIEALGPLGFAPRRLLLLSESHTPFLVRNRVECANEDGSIRVIISKHPLHLQSAQTRIIAATTLDNGDECVTSSHDPERLLPVSPRLKAEAIEGATVQEVVARHRERLQEAASRGVRAVPDSPEEALQREVLISNEGVEAFRASGSSTTDSAGRLCWKFFPALVKTWQILRQSAAKRSALKLRAKGGRVYKRYVGPDSQLDFDWEYYQFWSAVRKGNMTWVAKTLVMLGSLAVFGLVLGWRLSPASMLIIVAVLVFHEGGHLLGMRLFGFRDTQLLFLPFLGGAAVGRDSVVLKPWQNLVMLFLGPLPGLFIGMALIAFGVLSPPWVHELALVLIFLNAFNLLPFLPLDGGQIVGTVFAGSFPFLKVAFTAISGLAVIGISLSVPGVTLLLVVGLFMLLRLPGEYQQAVLIRRLRRELPPGADEEAVMRRLLREFREPKWAKVAFPQRIAQASALQVKLRQPPPSWRDLLLAGVCYTSPVWLGMAIFAGAARVRFGQPGAADHSAAAAQPEEFPDYVPPSIPDADNAAIPLAAAVERMEKGAGGETRNGRMAEDDEDDTEVTALLRDAAARTGFSPTREWLDAPQRIGDFQLALAYLAKRAATQRKLHDADSALALALDGLRLERHLETVPGHWEFIYHSEARRELMSVVEDCLADEKGSSPDLIARIAAEIDVPADFDFSRKSILMQDAALRKRMMDRSQRGAREGGEGILLRAFLYVMGMMEDPNRARRIQQEHGRRARALLDGIATGKWPTQEDIDYRKMGGEGVMIAMLADDTASMRMANTALAICWQGRTSGRLPAGFGDIKVAWWGGIPEHPITHKALQWREAKRVGILSFPLGARESDSQQGVETLFGKLEWRLPVRSGDSS